MKILIAEDNQTLQKFNEQLMNIWGYDFDMVSNGKEAIEHAQKNEEIYDLCLMDIEMPIMNGLQATKAIRQNLKYFPILAFSGSATHRNKCFEVGMDDFFEKPCYPDELHEKIIELTVKAYIIQMIGNQTTVKKEMPMDVEHAKELRELRKKGLTKLCIHGSGGEFTFVVDERVQNKISYDLIGKKQELSKFLDRSEDRPGLCHLYKGNFMVNKKYLLSDEFEEHKKEEESILKECKNEVVQPLDN